MYGFGLKFIEVCSAGPINYISPLVQIMNWHRPVASHYLNHWSQVYWRIYVSHGPNGLTWMNKKFQYGANDSENNYFGHINTNLLSILLRIAKYDSLIH